MSITRLKLILQYKGTRFSGWQAQPNGNTIQQHLEKALSTILRQKIRVHGASRTDAGVHALGQVCHCDVVGAIHPIKRGRSLCGELPLPDKLRHGLNSILPDDICVVSVEKVPNTFNAQKSAKGKTYVYHILNSAVPSPFLRDYVWRVPYPLNVAAMKKAGKYLAGKHDFKSFCAADSGVLTTVRTVYEMSIKRVKQAGHLAGFNPTDPSDRSDRSDLFSLTLEGNGFLKQMVRNIVGTLVDVGRGKITPNEVKKILGHRDRRRAGMSAPAKGLVLKKIVY